MAGVMLIEMINCFTRVIFGLYYLLVLIDPFRSQTSKLAFGKWVCSLLMPVKLCFNVAAHLTKAIQKFSVATSSRRSKTIGVLSFVPLCWVKMLLFQDLYMLTHYMNVSWLQKRPWSSFGQNLKQTQTNLKHLITNAFESSCVLQPLRSVFRPSWFVLSLHNCADELGTARVASVNISNACTRWGSGSLSLRSTQQPNRRLKPEWDSTWMRFW